MNMEEKPTLQQKRAAYALKSLNLASKNPKVSKELSQFIVGMPNMILSNGIGQTMAFLLSKQGKTGQSDKTGKTFTILKEWLELRMPEQFSGTAEDLEFIKHFNEISQSDYLQAQRECLRLVEWLKRYARAFVEDSDNKKD